MVKLAASTKYRKRYKKQSEFIKKAVDEKEKIFLQNPFDARLDTHKLKGKDTEHWAYSVTFKIRIKFLFVASDSVFYLDIGTHDEVY